MTLETTFLILVAALLVSGFFVIVRMMRSMQKPGGDAQSLLLIQNQMNELTRTLDTKLSESTQTMQAQFGREVQMIQGVTEKLTSLDKTNQQVVSFADQLKSLQDILRNPKQRGVLGEYYLETLLKNVMGPGLYQMQYAFRDGTMVDAIVRVENKIVPIDSKFSLENYNRLAEAKEASERDRFEKIFANDLKNRIVETAKYIRPEEDTMDFAIMFIPHEAIYYDLLVNRVGAQTEENLLQRAASKYHVIIVSPTSFLAYLQTVLQGLRQMRMQESLQGVIKDLETLRKHMGSYGEYVKKLGTHLNTTVNMYNASYKELGKVDKDFRKITGTAAGIEPILIEGPRSGDEA